MDISTILATFAVILFGIFFKKYILKTNDYWQKRGVPCALDALPFFGNTLSVFLFSKEFSSFCNDMYTKNRKHSMVGYYENRKANLLLIDPELVKTVLISSFPNFHVNYLAINPDYDTLLAGTPFFSYGEEWRNSRSIMSNALMTSKKLKQNCGALRNVCAKFAKYLEENVKKSNGSYEVDSKDLFARYTGEVATNVAFGVEGDFFTNGSGPNSFMEAIYGCFDNTLLITIKCIVIFFIPALNEIFCLSFLPKHLNRFFRRMMSEVIAARKKDGIARNDFLQMMVESQTGENGSVDEARVTPLATAFFVAAYETSTVTFTFFAYQLAANPEVQEKVRCELNDVMDKYNGEIFYESLREMTYMEQALNESMRLHPAIGFLMKKCSQECKLIGSDGIECNVEPGTDILISVRGLHEDPEYWVNPKKYDPNRFSADSKKDRPGGVFLPFGEGPRICVGMRFAVMQIKWAIATILRSYRIELSPKTKIPLKFKHAALTTVVGGLWIILKPL